MRSCFRLAPVCLLIATSAFGAKVDVTKSSNGSTPIGDTFSFQVQEDGGLDVGDPPNPFRNVTTSSFDTLLVTSSDPALDTTITGVACGSDFFASCKATLMPGELEVLFSDPISDPTTGIVGIGSQHEFAFVLEGFSADEGFGVQANGGSTPEPGTALPVAFGAGLFAAAYFLRNSLRRA